MPAYKVNAIVLRRNDLGETDRILRLLTRENGRVDAVAKGARRGASKLSGATEPFTLSRMLLATGKSLDIVSQCEIRESFPALRGDLGCLSRATYLCELAERFIAEREPNQEVFDLLLSALYLLRRVQSGVGLDVIVHSFELRLLSERGYHPALGHCVKCMQPIKGARLAFSPAMGGMLCSMDRFEAEDSIAIGPDSLNLMLQLMNAGPDELVNLLPEVNAMDQVARCLKWYIRHRSDRDLHSAEFVEIVRAGYRG